MRQAPRQPNEAESRIEPDKDDNLIVQTREYELITPLFGGGVEPGQCDDLTPIRGTEIRGHLRFWWRATRGGNTLFEGNLGKMKEKEDEIWGAASTKDQASPSQVKVLAICNDAHTGTNLGNDENLDRPFEVVRGKVEPREGSIVPAYIAFPLQPTTEEAAELGRSRKPTKAVRINVKFKLTISFPEKYRTEVEAALWAWETFGGIGARTRRGFGALRLMRIVTEDGQEKERDLPASTAVVTKWIQKRFGDFDVKGQWPEHVPHLPGINRIKVTKAEKQEDKAARGRVSQASAAKSRELEIWEYLAEKLRLFRQSRYDKNHGLDHYNAYGLSRWPEAEEIRHRLGITSRNELLKGIHRFPRAKLGLPIIFHLPHDGEEVELNGAISNRRASPLIFRPLVCADGKAVGLALVLVPESLPPDTMRLVRQKTPVAGNSIEVEPGTDLYKIHPLRREKDIFKAFFDTL